MTHTNKTVHVNAFYFAGAGSGTMKTFPRQIEIDDSHLTFLDGLQYLVRKGQNTIRLFDMNDGRMTYRLRLENDTWTLVGAR